MIQNGHLVKSSTVISPEDRKQIVAVFNYFKKPFTYHYYWYHSPNEMKDLPTDFSFTEYFGFDSKELN